MFDRQMRQYVELVRPWCSSEWTTERVNSDDFTATFTDPSRLVFPIPERDLPGYWESLFLGRRKTEALCELIAWVQRFNMVCDLYAMAQPADRLMQARLLHGVIGASGYGTLRDVFVSAEGALKC